MAVTGANGDRFTEPANQGRRGAVALCPLAELIAQVLAPALDLSVTEQNTGVIRAGAEGDRVRDAANGSWSSPDVVAVNLSVLGQVSQS